MANPLVRVEKFLGIDNTSDPAKVGTKGTGIYLVEADNCDIDDEGMLHRRDGGDELILSGSGKHSIWSNGEIFLFVDGTDFKKMNEDYSLTTLVTNIDPTDKMCYVDVEGTIYFSNNSIVGYVKNGLPYPFPDPNQTFKTRMVGGQILEYYNHRLYAAHGKFLYFSDPIILTRRDKRTNVIPFNDRITMVKAVADGLYVSAGKDVSFLKGSVPSEFVTTHLLDFPAIEGTSATLYGDDIGRGATGKAIYFLTECGPYKGYPGGILIERQDGLFSVEDIEAGTAIIKTDCGFQQYLALCPLKPGLGGASGSFKLPKPKMES